MPRHRTPPKPTSDAGPEPVDPETPETSVPVEPPDDPRDACADEGAIDESTLPAPVQALIAQLRAERDEAVEGRKRAQADFLNYQRRSRENELRSHQAGVGSVVRSLMPALDHVDLALGHDHDAITTEQLLDGVRMVRDELLKALEGHVVRLVKPEPGDEFDPQLHQAVMRECTDRQPPNTVVAVLQVGYALDEIVLRPAVVTVAAAPEAAAPDDAAPEA